MKATVAAIAVLLALGIFVPKASADSCHRRDRYYSSRHTKVVIIERRVYYRPARRVVYAPRYPVVYRPVYCRSPRFAFGVSF